MSEDGEMWAAHRKDMQERKEQRRQKGYCQIDDLCSEHGIEYEHLNSYQIRAFGKKTVDIYQTNKKYCVLGKPPIWGRYGTINELLNHLK